MAHPSTGHAAPEGCEVAKPGATDSGAIPWAQRRLRFDRVHEFATGEGITVAVIDSGLSSEHPKVGAIDLVNPTNAIPGQDDIVDCQPDGGHGTAVTAIIAAPAEAGVGFRGLAPDARVMPIKYYDPDLRDPGGAAELAAGINAAVDADVDVINLSLAVSNDLPAVRQALVRAREADIVVVAASGNERASDTASRYPGKYAEDPDEFPHLIAVGATVEGDGMLPQSTTGSYVGVAAPGGDVWAPVPSIGAAWYTTHSGTSFAAPFVSATAALILETFPKMSAPEVVQRIKATASDPGVAVPNDQYGHGIVDPYLAVTLPGKEVQLEPERAELPPAPAPDLPPPPDRTLQNLAYAVGSGLFGLAILAGIGSIVVRHTASQRRQA